jgi:hypothetical protein
MPIEVKLSLSRDATKGSVGIARRKPVAMSADELGDFIRTLAVLRASMQPAHPPENPTQKTIFAAAPAIRWYVTGDTIPGQVRLCLLHPGLGWIWMPLHQEALDGISNTARLILQPSTSGEVH